MRLVALLLTAALVGAVCFSPHASAAIERPRFALGDFWTYETNLTDELGLRFVGQSTVEAFADTTVTIQGLTVPVVEFLLVGGGRFSATEELGSAEGTWGLSGLERWETGAWRSVSSYIRLVAQGTLEEESIPIPFTLEIVNSTTRRLIADTWPWPISAGDRGEVTARWNGTQRVTFDLVGSPPETNETAFDAALRTVYAHVRSEPVSVAAGTFDAEVVREDRPEGGYVLRWIAARAGNDVRRITYNETGVQIATSELAAFAYAAGVPPPPLPWLPILLASLGAAAVLLLLLVRRRGKADPIWIPPERPASP